MSIQNSNEAAGEGLLAAIQRSARLDRKYASLSEREIQYQVLEMVYGKQYADRQRELDGVKNYIKEDEDYMAIKDILLTTEETNKAVVTNPVSHFLEHLLKDSEFLINLYPIGRMIYGKFTDDKYTNICIILGYKIKGAVYNNNKEAAIAFNKCSNTEVNGIDYLLYDVNTHKLIAVDRRTINNNSGTLNNKQELDTIKKLKYKVKDSNLSGKVFGFPKVKAELIGRSYTPVEFSRGISKKLEQETYYIVVTDRDTKRNFKFCITDLELVLPNIKGYNFPKNRDIKMGSKVVIKSNKSVVYKVQNVYYNSTSKRLGKNTINRQLDVLVLVKDGGEKAGDISKVYAKNVKLV